MINVGTIPENFSFTDVYTFHVDELPSLLVARRASADELIWDAEGGFTDQWNDRSSYEVGDGGGYDFHIARRSFSVAGLPIFAAGEGGGGGTGILDGDVTGDSDDNTVVAIQNIPVVLDGTPSVGDALVYRESGGEPRLVFETPEGVGDATSILGEAIPTLSTGALTYNGTDLVWAPGGGSGDVVGPASAVADRVATFNGTTGKIIKDSGISAAALAAIAAAVPTRIYSGYLPSPETMVYGNGWADCFAAITSGTWVDRIQSGITRSGSSITVAEAGYYQIHTHWPAYSSSTPPLSALRLKVNGTVVDSELDYPGSSTSGLAANMHLHSNLLLNANDVLTFEYAHAVGSPTFGITNNQVQGANVNVAKIDIFRIAATLQPLAVPVIGGWQRVADINYTQLSAQTLTNGSVTLGGVPHTIANVGNMAYSRIDSTGMTSKASATSIANFYQDVSTGFTANINLADIAPDFVVGQSQLRVWWQGGSNGNANHEVNVMGIAKAPYTGGVSAQSGWFFVVGSYDSLSPHQGIIAGRGTSSSPSRGDADLTSVTVANSLNSVWGMHMMSPFELNFYTYNTASADSASNDTAARWPLMSLRAQIVEPSTIVKPAQVSVPPAFNLSTIEGILKVADINILVCAVSTYNTSAHAISTTKRLVVEVKY